jgi:hypothetical protein
MDSAQGRKLLTATKHSSLFCRSINDKEKVFFILTLAEYDYSEEDTLVEAEAEVEADGEDKNGERAVDHFFKGAITEPGKQPRRFEKKPATLLSSFFKKIPSFKIHHKPPFPIVPSRKSSGVKLKKLFCP